MEPTPERSVYIFCTCSYTTDGKVLASVRPQVISIQKLSITDKIQINGYRWMHDGGFIWLSIEEFIHIYDRDWEVMVANYSFDWLKRIKSLVASD